MRMTTGMLHHCIGCCGEPSPVFGKPGVMPPEVLPPVVPPGVPPPDVVVHEVGAVMVSAVVETVPANAKALPIHPTVLPIVIPEASMSVPTNVEVAPKVVAAPGVHQTLQADAPLANVTIELAEVLSAPVILKM